MEYVEMKRALGRRRKGTRRRGEMGNVKVTTVVTPSLVTHKSHQTLSTSHATYQSCVTPRDALIDTIPICPHET